MGSYGLPPSPPSILMQRSNLPEDMYWPSGHFGQVAMIIPSRQLIVVRQGWSQMGGFDEYMEQVMQRILAAVKTPLPK